MSSTGIGTVNDFRPDGSAVCSANAFCVGSASWTCSGNQLTYNNGMSNTVLTLSPDGAKMTGMGGWPSNLQTAIRMGGGAAPATAAGEGDLLVTAAKASEQYCTYADQMKAAGNYGNAAEAYKREGNNARSRWAAARMKAASDRADRCESKTSPSRTRASQSAGQTANSEGEGCAAAVAYMKDLGARGEPIGVMRLQLAARGCKVGALQPSSRSERLKDCLRFELALESEGKTKSHIAIQKRLAGCRS